MSRVQRPRKDFLQADLFEWHSQADSYMNQCEADIAELVESLTELLELCEDFDDQIESEWGSRRSTERRWKENDMPEEMVRARDLLQEYKEGKK